MAGQPWDIGSRLDQSEDIPLDRITITIEPELLAALDGFVQSKGYAGRSEALRDVLRERLQSEINQQGGEGQCLAALTYVYDHHKRQLANRLTDLHHDHHDLTIATMHVHLNHESCLEIAVLRGEVGQVRRLSESITSQSGVRFGNTNFVPVNITVQSHRHHGTDEHGHHEAHDSGRAHEHIRTLVWKPGT